LEESCTELNPAFIFINDTWVTDASVSIHDRGFLFGDGIFESIRSYRGVPFLLDRHLQRLVRSAEKLELNIPKTTEELPCIVKEILKKNLVSEGYIRITLSRGLNGRGIDIDPLSIGTLVVTAVPFSLSYEKMKICFVKTVKTPPEALDPSIKSANFLNNIMAKREAKKKGCSEGIMLSISGHVAEGSISNIFWTKDGVLFTPDLGVGILPGITRELILEIAEDENIPVNTGYFPPENLINADDIFLTNSLMEIMPAEYLNSPRAKTNSEIRKLLIEKYREKIICCQN